MTTKKELQEKINKLEEEITFDYNLISGLEPPIPTWEIRFTYFHNNSIIYEENETIEFEFEDTIGIKNYINNELQYELDSKLLDSELYSVELWYVLYDITEYENQTLWKKN